MTQFGGSLPVTHIRESVTLQSAELTTVIVNSSAVHSTRLVVRSAQIVATELELNWLVKSKLSMSWSTCTSGWAGLRWVEIYRRLMS